MVLCGSNGYEKKYYLNEVFDRLPEAVKKELQVMCVWFTEECGGILTLEFEEDGTLRPAGQTTRAQLAKLLNVLCGSVLK